MGEELKSWLETAEDRISELENRYEEIIQNVAHRVERMKNVKESLDDRLSLIFI